MNETEVVDHVVDHQQPDAIKESEAPILANIDEVAPRLSIASLPGSIPVPEWVEQAIDQALAEQENVATVEPIAVQYPTEELAFYGRKFGISAEDLQTPRFLQLVLAKIAADKLILDLCERVRAIQLPKRTYSPELIEHYRSRFDWTAKQVTADAGKKYAIELSIQQDQHIEAQRQAIALIEALREDNGVLEKRYGLAIKVIARLTKAKAKAGQ